jgi:REP element-mobilizing transposase RayT
LLTLEQTCQKTDWQVHAFCLMGNHFHLVSKHRARIWSLE